MMMSDNERSNWRELPAGLMLDSYIAFHAGYIVTGASNGMLWGKRPGHDIPLQIPAWSTDMNAAVKLPIANGVTLEVSIYGDKSCGIMIYGNGGAWRGSANRLEDLPHAIIEAWLNWRESGFESAPPPTTDEGMNDDQ